MATVKCKINNNKINIFNEKQHEQQQQQHMKRQLAHAHPKTHTHTPSLLPTLLHTHTYIKLNQRRITLELANKIKKKTKKTAYKAKEKVNVKQCRKRET